MAMNRNHLKKHIYASYFSLRIGMAIIGIVLPVLVWLVAKQIEGLDLLGSISAYYHTASRDVFVGSLFAIGASAYLYKGYSHEENLAMNLAGIFAVGVAIFPTDLPCTQDCERSVESAIHLFCAISFFLLIAYVCLFRSNDTVSEIPDETAQKNYRRIYRLLGCALVVFPALIFVDSLNTMTVDFMGDSTIFWIEAVSIWVFAVFWLVKSYEIARYGIEDPSKIAAI